MLFSPGIANFLSVRYARTRKNMEKVLSGPRCDWVIPPTRQLPGEADGRSLPASHHLHRTTVAYLHIYRTISTTPNPLTQPNQRPRYFIIRPSFSLHGKWPHSLSLLPYLPSSTTSQITEQSWKRAEGAQGFQCILQFPSAFA